MAGTKTTGQTVGLEYVGHHHQPDLPPIVQEIPCRSAEAERTASPVSLRSEANRTPRSDRCWSLPRAPAAATPTRGTTGDAVLHPKPDSPARGHGGFLGPGRGGQ